MISSPKIRKYHLLVYHQLPCNAYRSYCNVSLEILKCSSGMSFYVEGNPKLRAFISKCDQNSLMESVYSGVPIICIPLHTDQPRNGKLVEKFGNGIAINKREITADKLITALKSILSTKM